jgi:hypothetical protein
MLEDSAAVANTSFASNSSEISTRSSLFRDSVQNIIAGNTPSLDLVGKAKDMISNLSSHNVYNRVGTEYTSSNMFDVKLHRILESMLNYAGECGGENGLRYTAAAIFACYQQDDEETLKYLQSLATTWLSHLLYVCKWSFFVPRHIYELL